jgi:hypothetical protein
MSLQPLQELGEVSIFFCVAETTDLGGLGRREREREREREMEREREREREGEGEEGGGRREGERQEVVVRQRRWQGKAGGTGGEKKTSTYGVFINSPVHVIHAQKRSDLS